MQPTADDYVALVQEVRTLLALQHAGAQRIWPEQPELLPGAAKLLAELASCGRARVSELAERRMVDVSVISRQVAQLTKLGYLERQRASTDARVVLLTVTPAGEQALQRWRAQQVHLLRAALADWDADRLRTATDVLHSINSDLRVALEPGGPAVVNPAVHSRTVVHSSVHSSPQAAQPR